ncbi:MAG: hypothetical protein KF699_05575 [Phycisphaeraceae bacterium]|nr:hypothetical protein [Phycisphaeraceae bacterium]
MWTLDQAGLCLGAAVSLGIGAYFVWFLPRKCGGDRDGTCRYRGGSLSLPTRMVIGVSMLVLGYHLAVWALPAGMTNVRVPRERWWVVALGVAAAIGGSCVLDRSMSGDGRGGGHSGPGAGGDGPV